MYWKETEKEAGDGPFLKTTFNFKLRLNDATIPKNSLSLIPCLGTFILTCSCTSLLRGEYWLLLPTIRSETCGNGFEMNIDSRTRFRNAISEGMPMTWKPKSKWITGHILDLGMEWNKNCCTKAITFFSFFFYWAIPGHFLFIFVFQDSWQ